MLVNNFLGTSWDLTFNVLPIEGFKPRLAAYRDEDGDFIIIIHKLEVLFAKRPITTNNKCQR